MSKAFYLIPGLRLPSNNFDAIYAHLSEQSKSILSRLTDGLDEMHSQWLADPQHLHCPHWVWLWKVLTRKSTIPQSAPWQWLHFGGPQVATQMWHLTPCKSKDHVRFNLSDALRDEDFFALTDFFHAELSAYGFRLQIWENAWFAVRQKDWNVSAAPFVEIEGRPLSDEMIEGADRDTLTECLEKIHTGLLTHPINEKRRQEGLETIDDIWLWGGARDARFYPPSKIRSLASDSSIVLGWAYASGILKAHLLSTQQGCWSEKAPEGDVVVVIDELYEAWRTQNWTLWEEQLPSVLEKLESFKRDAQKKKIEETVLVAFGQGGAATLTSKEKSLLNFFSSSKTMPLSQWLVDSYDKDAS